MGITAVSLEDLSPLLNKDESLSLNVCRGVCRLGQGGLHWCCRAPISSAPASESPALGEALARQDPRLPPPDPATTQRSTLAARTLRGLRGLRAMEDGPGVAGGCMGARLEGSGAPDYRRERAVAARLDDGKSSAAETPYSGGGSKLHEYMYRRSSAKGHKRILTTREIVHLLTQASSKRPSIH